MATITTNKAAIIALFRVINGMSATCRQCRACFLPHRPPVIREPEGGREMVMMRGGMPPPLRTGGPPVTNIPNTSSPHWRGWLRPENRCLVPFNSFAEYAPEPLPGDAFKIVMRGADKEDKSAAMKKAGGQ